MGYDLSIAKEGYDWETQAFYITPEEWLAYVENDKELELSEGLNHGVTKEWWLSDRSVYWEWNAHPAGYGPGMRPWFNYWKGMINTKNPDVIIIRKMLQIASALNAIVEGEGGEIYTEESLAELENLTVQVAAEQPAKCPWWKFW